MFFVVAKVLKISVKNSIQQPFHPEPAATATVITVRLLPRSVVLEARVWRFIDWGQKFLYPVKRAVGHRHGSHRFMFIWRVCMFQSVVNAVRNTFVQQPGTIVGAGLEHDTIKAEPDVTLSFSPVSAFPPAGVRMGPPPQAINPLVGYTFEGQVAGESVWGMLAPEKFNEIAANLREQERIHGRVIDIPAALGGTKIPTPNLSAFEE